MCSENPLYVNTAISQFICYAAFFVNTENGNQLVTRRCFYDPHSYCPEECVPVLHVLFESDSEALYDCCCVGNLCNQINNTGKTSVCIRIADIAVYTNTS